MSRENLIYRLNSIQHYYGKKKVLDIQALDFKAGSITGLAGPNGSGKSTLLKLLAFAFKPSHGTVFYKSKPEQPFSQAVRSRVTLLAQTPFLLKRSVFENIAYGLRIRRDTRQIKKRIRESLEAVGLDFERFAQRMPHELSGGEAQRVAMAARLILKPEVLLLDEPVASVDVESAGRIRQASLKARNDWGTTLVIASHDRQWLFSASERQLSLLNGSVFATGDENIIPGPFLSENDHQVTKKLADGRIIRLGAPDEGQQMALLKKEKTLLLPEGSACSNESNALSGQVLSMHLDHQHGLVMITIAICELNFELSLSSEHVSQLGLLPGSSVTMTFDPQDAVWI